MTRNVTNVNANAGAESDCRKYLKLNTDPEGSRIIVELKKEKERSRKGSN
jgi:hypothetical protein